MTKSLIKVVAAAAFLVPAFAFAQSQAEAVGGERGVIFKDTPSTITRDQVRSELRAGKTAGDAHWRFAGGESGWTHTGPSIAIENGSLVHASDCPYLATLSAPKPAPGGSPGFGYTGA